MICYLKITTWIGVGIGASHYYGELKPQGAHSTNWIKLKRKLTTHSSAKMNKARRESHPGEYQTLGDMYEPGMEVENFDSRQAVVKLALETYKNIFPDCSILFEDDGHTSEPVKVLDGPGELMKLGNRLYSQNERLHESGGWDNPKNVERMEAIGRTWRELISDYEVKVR